MIRYKGFTLIELIVVMGILAILATIVIIAVNPGRQFAASRNSKRVSDTRAIAQALDQYASNNNGINYASLTTSQQTIGTSNLDLTAVLVPNYLSSIPTDPTNGTAANTGYSVYLDSSNRVHVLSLTPERGSVISSTPNLNPFAVNFVTASSQSLTKGDHVDLRGGATNLTVAAWVYLQSPKPTSENPIIAKGGTGTAIEYRLNYTGSGSGDRFRFEWYTASAVYTTVTANSFGSPTAAGWHYVVAWRDATANTINIQINNGPVDTASVTGGFTATEGFYICIRGGAMCTARMDSAALWRRVLTSDERTALYNSGSGLTYNDLYSSHKTNLIGWWDMDTVGNIGKDSHSTHDLTNNGASTQVAR